jgi:hypothetical protein
MGKTMEKVTGKSKPADAGKPGDPKGPGLHIFVNRRKFEIGDGVKETMTGGEIAALVDVPTDNAVVRLESGPEKREVPIGETIQIKNGQQFLVTRKVVEGGYVP